VDKYGLALYLSGRLTGLATLLGVTAGVRAGVDVPSALASVGLDPGGLTGIGAAVAALAAASAANTLLTPLHFLGESACSRTDLRPGATSSTCYPQEEPAAHSNYAKVLLRLASL